MYVKTSTRKTKNGAVRYLHLAHNEWDPVAGRSVPKLLHSFGREDQLDRDAVKRLVDSLARLLDPKDALAATVDADLTFVESRPLGGSYALDQLWHRLGIPKAITSAPQRGRGRPRDREATERVLFGLVASRALAPSSKLAAADWISNDVHIDGLDQVDEDTCYRAMDWLHRIEPHLAKQIYFQVTDLLNLEVDLLFFDTTSTYFETEQPDEPVARDANGERLPGDAEPRLAAKEAGFRTFGKSKDSRDDLPQVVIGMAVTRDGIPVRVWSWPGNSTDTNLIRQAREDLREWSLSRVVWVADRGFTSAANRRALMQGGGGYIIGEKLRSESPQIKQALSRQGRYATVRDNLQVKEVNIDSDDRFVICFNPEQAERDAAIRARMVDSLEEAIAGSDKLTATERAHLAGQLSTKPGPKRYLRTTPGGLLRIDKKKIAAETNLDGKYLLRSSDPKLSAEDIALGYKQLLEVERGWRDMKSIIDLRPVYHRLEDRIRAHVFLCWLALLLIRIAENTTGSTWTEIRRQLDRLHVGTFTGPAGLFRQRTKLTPAQRELFTKLNLTPPKQIVELAHQAR
jgi:transposase